jgi:TolB-like protein
MAFCHRAQFALHLKGRAVDVKQVGRELGIRYVLEGSVRKAGNRVRVTAQLIDPTAGTHLSGLDFT